MTNSSMSNGQSSSYTHTQSIAFDAAPNEVNELAPLPFNDRSTLRLPKLMPRSAIARTSLTSSPSDSHTFLGDDIQSDSDQDIGSSRPKPRQAKAGRLSMMDFLSAADTNNDDAPFLESSQSMLAAPNGKQQSSNRNGARKSVGLVPRLGSLSNSSSSVFSSPVPSMNIPIPRRGSSGEKSLPPPTRTESPQPKVQELFTITPRGENDSPPSAKGKRRADVDSMPLIQLKVVPVTDSIIMFGSTQTSSNYSLSGMVVVRISNQKYRERGSSGGPIKRRDSPLEVGLEQGLANGIARDTSPRPRNASQGDTDEAEDLRIRSLQVIFSGFALYVDHIGRFSAMRLAHVKQELLAQGTSIPLATNSGQEYEIEFDLPVPGWLPSTLSTRFGGTFYCLEAKMEYSDGSVAEQMPMTALVPPRQTSRAASPSPLSSSLDTSSYDSDTPLSSAAIAANSDYHIRRNLASSLFMGSQVKDHDTTNGSSRKGSWLSKLTKSSSKMSTSSATSSTTSTPTQTTFDARSPQPVLQQLSPSAMQCSSVNGFNLAQSKAKAIIVARCREVVPVPVARMAIIGPEGLPEGAHQDPPPMVRSSSVDGGTRSRSSTLTRTSVFASPTRRSHSPPPVAPSAFNAPSDPAKLAIHTSQPRTPQRASSNTQVFHARGGGPPRSSPNASPSNTRHSRSQNYPYSSSSTIPMRHFLHRPMLHPPADAQIPDVDGGLQFSLTLTLPSYVSVDGPGSEVLNFGVQIEVGRSASWSKVRELGGLRLRDMELSCVQTERHSSVASRTFCHSYPLPVDSKIGPHELPIMESWRGSIDKHRSSSQQDAAKLRAGYDRAMIEDHMELVRRGKAPTAFEQNVERVRVAVVGPPYSHSSQTKARESRDRREEGSRGKDKERDKDAAKDDSIGRNANSKKGRRRSLPASVSAPSGLVGHLPSDEGSSNDPLDDFVPPMPEREDTTEANKKTTTGRGRRAYQSAIRGLSNLATAVMDITLDTEGGGYGPPQSETSAQKKKSDDESKHTAVYSFAGSDGHGVDLTRGRVRMAINLPLVSSNVYRAKTSGTPRLVADFESPYIRVRHKLKVKLGFGFGSKPLGGEGDGNWGQALVMCVPVRFTDSAPREVREQFAPMPIAQVASSVSGLPSMPKANKINGNDAPLLPSYNQLFREDGSRLADEGEDLPQYPGPANRRISTVMPSSGSVTAPSPLIGSNSIGENGLIDELATTFDNRITPSRVLDESVPEDALSDDVSRQQRLELQEMQEEEEDEQQQQVHTADRMNETVNMDDELDFGEDDAIGAFSSSDHQARSNGLDDEDTSTGEDEYHNC
jgi:hypothetical protein